MQDSERPLILSIETATRAGSIAVLRGHTLLAARTGQPGRSHSTDLLDLVRDSLAEAGCGVQDVELFAVALGPGSFTGLRIGIATAKGLAATLGREMVGVPTLQAVALAAGRGERVVALLPAGRGELFAQSFRVEDPSTVVALDNPAYIAPATLLEKFRHLRTVLWSGEGAEAHREKIRALAEQEGIRYREESINEDESLDEGWRLARTPENLAANLGALALEKQKRGETSRPEELQAIYVRPSDAELKETCRTQG